VDEEAELRHRREQHRRLAGQGWEVTVATFERQRSLLMSGRDVQRCFSIPGFLESRARDLK
jgi:uncharacterized protein YbjT (DUF2867 family)